MSIFPRLEKRYPCDFCLLQETQTSSTEEAELENKFTKRGKTLSLSSWDKNEAAFEARIDNTAKKGKWGTGIIQYTDTEMKSIETGNDRFQMTYNDNMLITNVYFPTDRGMEGVEDYEVCLKELELLLERELGDRELAVIGDVNYQPNHHQRRREALESLCKKFNLTRHVPKETTYFAPGTGTWTNTVTNSVTYFSVEHNLSSDSTREPRQMSVFLNVVPDIITIGHLRNLKVSPSIKILLLAMSFKTRRGYQGCKVLFCILSGIILSTTGKHFLT